MTANDSTPLLKRFGLAVGQQIFSKVCISTPMGGEVLLKPDVYVPIKPCNILWGFGKHSAISQLPRPFDRELWILISSPGILIVGHINRGAASVQGASGQSRLPSVVSINIFTSPLIANSAGIYSTSR